MDSQRPDLSPEHRDQADLIAAGQPCNAAEENKAPKVAPPTEDDINSMTIKKAVKPEADSENPRNTEVVTQQPGATSPMKPENYVIRIENLTDSPDYVDCPYCKSRQKTKVRKESTSQTTLAAGLCCLCFCIIPVFIPFVCNWCADTDHYCDGCHQRVAHKPHEGRMEPVLPPASPTRLQGDSRYQPSQYADMSKESRQELEAGRTGQV